MKEFSLYGPRFSSDDYAEDGVLVLRTSDISEAGRVDLATIQSICEQRVREKAAAYARIDDDVAALVTAQEAQITEGREERMLDGGGVERPGDRRGNPGHRFRDVDRRPRRGGTGNRRISA